MKPVQVIAITGLLLAGLLAVVFWPDPVRRATGLPSGGALHAPAATIDLKALTFASDPWPPYAGEASAPRPGYIVELLREIYEPLGYRVNYQNQPWSRCIEEVRHGRLTGLAGADRGEVPDFVFPQLTVGVTRPTIFVRADSKWRYAGLDSLAEVRLGVIQDYTYAAEIDHYIRAQSLSGKILAAKGSDALERLVLAVLDGRIDALVENAPVVQATLVRMGLPPGALHEAGAAGKGLPLYVPFSPQRTDAAQLAAQFDSGVARLRSSGRLAAILAVYGLSDWSLPEVATWNRSETVTKVLPRR